MLVPALATLMVNFGSIRLFEPDRSALVRLVVTVLIGLLVARLVLRGDPVEAWHAINRGRCVAWLRARPLAVAVIVYGLAILASTVMGLDPGRSLLGSYERGFGTALEFAAMATAAVVASGVRTVSAVRRVPAGAQFGIVGAAVIALLQYGSLVDLPSVELAASRPVGTIGNPLFLGAVMTIGLPLAVSLALASLVTAARSAVGAAPSGSPRPALRRGLVRASALLLLSGGYALTADLSAVPSFWALWPVTIVVSAALWFGSEDERPRRAGDRASLTVVSGFGVLLVVVGSVRGGAPLISVAGGAPWLVLALLAGAGALPDDDGRSGDDEAPASELRTARWLAAGGWLLVAAIEAAALVVAGSRGPLIGAVVGVAAMLVVAVLRARPDTVARRLMLTAGALTVVALTATLAVGAGARGSGFDFDAGTGLERRLIWIGDETGGGVWEIIAGAPIGRVAVGYGAESLPLLFERSYPVALGLLIDYAVPDRAHSIPLDLLVHHGLFGLVAWTACAALACRRCWQLAKASTPRGRMVACGLLGGMVGHVVEGLSGIVVVPTLVLWWLMIGLVVALSDLERSSGPETERAGAHTGRSPRRSRARLVVAMLGAAVVIGAAPLHSLTVLADMRLAEARVVEQRLAGLDTVESRGAILNAYGAAIQLAPHEPVFREAYGDAAWRLADRSALMAAPVGTETPSPESLADPVAATRFLRGATRVGLLEAAWVAFEGSHLARPELSSPLVSRSVVDLELFEATVNPAYLHRAIDGYRAAADRAPNQVHVLETLADTLARAGVLELQVERTSEAVGHLREAYDAYHHILVIGGSRVLRLNDRIDTVYRLLHEGSRE